MISLANEDIRSVNFAIQSNKAVVTLSIYGGVAVFSITLHGASANSANYIKCKQRTAILATQLSKDRLDGCLLLFV